MKFTLRLPTDVYAYIEQRIDVENAQEAVEAYKDLQKAWKGAEDGPGLPLKKWNDWLDGYMNGKAGSIDDWAEMDDRQKWCINEIKKAMKRTNNK